MFILSILLDLQTVQVDYTAAFLHADIDKDPNWANISEAERDKAGFIWKCLVVSEMKERYCG
jgi:hypothetical protein